MASLWSSCRGPCHRYGFAGSGTGSMIPSTVWSLRQTAVQYCEPTRLTAVEQAVASEINTAKLLAVEKLLWGHTPRKPGEGKQGKCRVASTTSLLTLPYTVTCVCITSLQGWAAGCAQELCTGYWLWALSTSALRLQTFSWCTSRLACLALVPCLTAHWQAWMPSAWTCGRSALSHKVCKPILCKSVLVHVTPHGARPACIYSDARVTFLQKLQRCSHFNRAHHMAQPLNSMQT